MASVRTATSQEARSLGDLRGRGLGGEADRKQRCSVMALGFRFGRVVRARVRIRACPYVRPEPRARYRRAERRDSCYSVVGGREFPEALWVKSPARIEAGPSSVRSMA